MSYEHELQIAIAAVRRAAQVCQAVQRAIPTSLEKADKSPVTIADFASQAVICQALSEEFPNDPIIGEEDSAELRRAENRPFLERVQAEVGRVGLHASPEEICRWIDCGGATSFGPRFWTLDPIDGTKGFLRGEQYAVSLALIVDGQITVAVLGCPNLPLVAGGDPASGSLFSAVRGQGATAVRIHENRRLGLRPDPVDVGTVGTVGMVGTESQPTLAERLAASMPLSNRFTSSSCSSS